MKNSGQKLWKRAKQIIPGGNQLLSKRSELFLPEYWPSYYKKAKGCEIWDLDGNKYFDFAGMGVSSCVLGYGDEYVANAVCKAVKEGSMGTLNSYEEVMLAEKLISLHSWASMARFARSGGEACSIAIRIARAASGKAGIAFCGYHGWHDWYLASNLSDSSNLNDQLLPGLNTLGVPKELEGTSYPFFYNDYDSFEKLMLTHGDKVGVIIMEPMRAEKPKDSFIKKIREYATKKNIVLIFDEVTSAFHNNFGGLHLTLGINPDIAIFAKALGNGYPISAIIGKKDIMDYAQETFISSTTWTERIGFTAGVATLEKMENESVQDTLVEYGKKIKNVWVEASKESGIEVKVNGLDSIPKFYFGYDNHAELLTYFNQEMLSLGFLATGGTAATYAYNQEIINKYHEAVLNVFKKISSLELDVKPQLKGPIKHMTFARVTG
tara:strand:- start:724 stop:2034 length:1311 start_codon:yes stop_codon:yes gene_type:complete